MDMDKKNLLCNVQRLGFAMVEANLYLNAYPHSEEALKYFQEMTCAYNDAVSKYEAVCGPLTAAANTGDCWDWALTPWPWELGVN